MPNSMNATGDDYMLQFAVMVTESLSDRQTRSMTPNHIAYQVSNLDDYNVKVYT